MLLAERIRAFLWSYVISRSTREIVGGIFSFGENWVKGRNAAAVKNHGELRNHIYSRD